jgi:hypothetical protein
MRHRFEPLTHLSGHPLCGRIRADEPGKCPLQFVQLPEQMIVGLIRDQRIIENVVAIVVIPNLMAKAFDSFSRFGFGHSVKLHVRVSLCLER